MIWCAQKKEVTRYLFPTVMILLRLQKVMNALSNINNLSGGRILWQFGTLVFLQAHYQYAKSRNWKRK